MATVVIMPKLGLTMTEGSIEKWLKQEGDRVKKGEPLVEIITEKLNFQYEAPASGVLRKILHQEGETIPVSTAIAILGEEGEVLQEGKDLQPAPEEKVSQPEPPLREPREPSRRIFVSPIARRIAKEKGVDLASLEGSGPGGRIVKADVLQAAEKTVREGTMTPPSRSAPSGKTIPLKGLRRVIAKRMTESFQNIPHFYLSLEIDMTACLALHEKMREEVEKRARVRLTLTDILVKIVASALRNHPMVNSRIEGDQILLIEDINIGVATALEDGLIVPVLHQADQKSFTEIAVALRGLTQRAKEGKLSLEEVGGGTFTLSNMGMLGIDTFNAIINPPQCSILGVGRTVKKPVVFENNIQIRPMAWFSLSSDHRIVDGATAALFLNDIKDFVENPALLLI
jgi:pyruvate dehydrogenase E2 component (dihydrolipoamide acetyltransferase)